MKELEKNQIIKKSGSTFIIIDYTDELYFAKQFTDDLKPNYEIGKITTTHDFTDKTKKYKTIPSAEMFGKNKFDASYPNRMVNGAISDWNKLTNHQITIEDVNTIKM